HEHVTRAPLVSHRRRLLLAPQPRGWWWSRHRRPPTERGRALGCLGPDRPSTTASPQAAVSNACRAARRLSAARLAGFAVLSALVEEVDQHVVAEGVRRREEGAAAVQLHHPLDEAAEVIALVEHERVDADAVTGAAHDLLEGLLDRDG